MEKAIKEIRIGEIRSLDDEEMITEGYAVVFDSPADLGWCKEIIDRNAFNGCDMKDCVLKYNHENSILIMARTRNKSLELIVDDKGLKIRAKLIDTTQNKDIYKMIKSGLLDKMSFAFSVTDEEIDYETNTRTIKKIGKLYDVSVVDVPAYDTTEIYARRQEEFEKDRQKYVDEKIQLRKKKMLLSI